MRIPLTPPSPTELIGRIQSERLFELLHQTVGPEQKGEYLHWDQLRHKSAPEGMNHEEWWFLVKQARMMNAQTIPFADPEGAPFSFTMTESLLQKLHQIDRNASGSIQTDAPITTDGNRDRYIISSLIEESITSSQLEGASTTSREARLMLRSGRKPRDRSEQMILNNFNAMSFIRDARDEVLSIELIRELHRILTEDTLDDKTGSGRWRKANENITVQDYSNGNVLYIPPHADLIPQRMKTLIDFANRDEQDKFIHPVVCAVILHFMLAYEHPFIDGNGRTARALFYWSMAKSRYWLIEFISISRIIKMAPVQYAKSFLFVETDGNDLSYFLGHQIDVIVKSIDALYSFLARKSQEYNKTESFIRGSLSKLLNHRQIALISHALKNPGFGYTINSHARSHSVVYQTARTDLLALAELGLLNQTSRRNAYVFISPPDLGQRIESIGSSN